LTAAFRQHGIMALFAFFSHQKNGTMKKDRINNVVVCLPVIKFKVLKNKLLQAGTGCVDRWMQEIF
jgi:hypothetical protein